MNEPVPVPADAPPLADRSPAAPLFCWLVIQLLALSLGALRVPLSARFPPPGEQFAVHIVLVAQVVASALLFPFLMRDAKTGVIVVLTIAPFVHLAGYLSMLSLPRAALATAYVAVWLTTLGLWRAILHTRSTRMLGVACAAALSVGGAIVWYARAEAGEAGPIEWSRDGTFGPVLGAIAQVEASLPLVAPWVVAMVLLIVSAALHYIARKRKVGQSGNARASS